MTTSTGNPGQRSVAARQPLAPVLDDACACRNERGAERVAENDPNLLFSREYLEVGGWERKCMD